jgi:hypothetical protein
METLTQEVEQRDTGVVQLDVPPYAVNGEADGEAHIGLRSMLGSNLDRGRSRRTCSTSRVVGIYGGILRFARDQRKFGAIGKTGTDFPKDHVQTKG